MRELIEVDGIRAVAVAGYSLGGNLALKLAGELGENPPPELRAVCAVSPTMDLAVCVEALERRANFAYQWNFVRNLKGRMRRKAAAFPGDFAVERLGRVWTVRQFDEVFTAPHHGFRDADDYYHRASAMRVVGRIRVPTLIVTAENDPFVPIAPFRTAEVSEHPLLTVIITAEGGHCAFVEPSNAEYDGYWAEREIVRYVSASISAFANSAPFPSSSCLK
jgi:predicted alpha/beta-fold hydrolase